MTVPDARVNHLEKENADLKTQIIQLKKANEWYMQRITEQGSVLSKASRVNSESNLLKKKENLRKGKRSLESNIPALNYYVIADQCDKLTYSIFQNLTSKSFQDIIVRIFKDTLFYIPADNYIAV